MTRLPDPPKFTRPGRQRWLLGGSAALVVAVVIVLVLVLSSGASAPPGSTLPRLASRVGPETMFNPGPSLTTNPVGTLAELKRLGVDRIHVYLHWADIAPDPTSRTKPSFDATDPAAYPASGWALTDKVVRQIKADGMGIDLALVSPAPDWAAGPGDSNPNTLSVWRPSAAEFGQFVRAVGTRYSGHYTPPGASAPLPRVNFWSVWNEPNLGIDLAPEAKPFSPVEIAPRLYRGLVDAAWSGLQATGHGADTVLIGEIAPAGGTFPGAPGFFGNMPPLRFLRAVYCVDSSYRPLAGQAARLRGCPASAAGSTAFPAQHPGLFKASGFADHPYPQGLPPNEPTPDEPDYAELAEIPKLERVLDTIQRVYGSSTRFPIWSTEFGYQTRPPDSEPGTVSPTTAAYYLNWSEYLTWLDPRIRSYDQYLLFDPPKAFFDSGLKFASGIEKPGYAAFRMPIFLPVTKTSSGDPLEVWGGVRPAHDAQLATHRTQQVEIQLQPRSPGAFKTVRTVTLTDRYGYFDVLVKFPASGNVRLAWSYPHGPQVFSRAVSIVLR